MSATAPSKLGRYEIVDEIGKGAMGVVYLAKDPLIGRLVALKTFRVGYSVKDTELAQFRARFIREAQSAGILSHPNIVTIHDVVDQGDEGTPFIAMEYVRGTNLKELLKGGKPLPWDFIVEVISQVADALDYAHSMGVVHRDVKPANIMITTDERVKITDFGIARLNTSNLTIEGQLLGTPNYMAPEQILGREVDHRADIFSLGVVLYEMLICRKPFQGENLTVVTHRIAYEPFTPPGEHGHELPPAAEAILAKALEKDPEDRYEKVSELAQELEQVKAPGPPAAEDPEATQDLTELLPTAGEGAARWAAAREGALEAVARLRALLARLPRPAVSAKRLLVAGAAAAALTLLVGGAATWVVAPGNEPAIEHSSEHRLRRLYVPFLAEGQLLLRDGDPLAAAVRFAQAERLAPGVSGIAELRREAEERAASLQESQARRWQVAALLGQGREALAAGRYDEAGEIAGMILSLDPDNREASSLGEAVEAVLSQRRARQAAEPSRAAAPRRQEEARQAAVQPSVSAEASTARREAAAVRTAELTIDFFSELSEGVLTIYADNRQVFRQGFRFVKKSGFFRSRPTSGRIRESLELPAGETTLRVYVTVPDRKITETVVLEGNFPGGSGRVLRVNLDGSGSASARLE